jgi:NADPH-dependent 2,4-dienoyl-CoA reductase/sulfur reductase-like enzyme
VGLDLGRRQVELADGRERFRALVVATGCAPVLPPLFRGRTDVFTLRRFEDAAAIRAAVADPARSVAVVGAGFIGGELASTLVKAGRRVAVVDLAPRPLGQFGAVLADTYADLHRRAGVSLHLGRGVVDVDDAGGHRVLLLSDGTRVPADVVVVGVGVRPALDWLAGNGLDLADGVATDTTLRAADGVYVAGDVARWHNARFDAVMRVEHWTSAAEQGRAAAANAVRHLRGDAGVPFTNVPYFWSDQHGVRIQFAGHLRGDEEHEVDRSPDGLLISYHRGDDVRGVIAVERRAEFVRARARLRTPLTRSQAAELGLGTSGAVPA